MFSSCMQDVHHAKNVHKQTCKMHEMENMQRTWSEMHVPSFSTPAGLRPNTNVGLHILLRYAPAERQGVHRMARDVVAGRNSSDSQVFGGLI